MVHFDVVIPIHNISLEQLYECLFSIESQTHQEFTIYVVESQQSANSETKNMVLSRGHNYLIQSGKGVSQARNEGVAAGNSPFIAFLDGDDKWLVNHLADMDDEIEFADENYVCWWGDYMIPTPLISMKTKAEITGKTLCGDHKSYARFRPEDWKYYTIPIPLYPSASIVRRTAFEQIGGFDESWLCWEDAIFFNDLAQIGLGKYVANTGCWGTIQTAGTHHTKIDGANTKEDRNYWFQKLQISTQFPAMDNKPPEVSDEYWQDLISYCCSQHTEKYSYDIDF